MDYKEIEIKVPRFSEANGFYTNKARSKLMSKIRAKDTKPEIKFRKALWAAGLRYRKHCPNLPGKPDVVNKKRKFAIFIDGEFWHGRDWETKKTKIKSNQGFWLPKIERNMQRDRENNFKLEKLGFKVFRFWEKEIKKEPERCVKVVLDWITSNPC